MTHRPRARAMVCLGWVVTALLVQGCSPLGYYVESIGGHFALLSKRRPVDTVLADPGTPSKLRRELGWARLARDFATHSLALPDNGSYRSYADLGRPFATWTVVATPALSLEPKTWCFPIVGCTSYRGYHSPRSAEGFASSLRSSGLDVYVGGARAYSTLGWFEDPILNTMLDEKRYYVVGLIFHELAHQRVYVAGDSTFNESYATAVEREGVRRFLRIRGTVSEAVAYRAHLEHRREFLQVVAATREALSGLFSLDISDSRKLERKRELFTVLRERHEELKESWGGISPYDGWFESQPNNAHLALISTYSGLVPGFERLLREHDGDFGRFHAAVESIGARPTEERRAAMQRLSAD